jgi:hypothetical protein
LLVYGKVVGCTNKRDRKGTWEKGGKSIEIPKTIIERGKWICCFPIIFDRSCSVYDNLHGKRMK